MSELASVLAQLDGDVQSAVIDALKSAQQARESCDVGEPDDGPEELHTRLLTCRASVDRLEHIAAQLGRVKAKTHQAMSDRRNEYDDAYAQAATAKQVGFADYATAKEKDAHHSLKVVAEIMALRKAERQHRDIDSAWEYVRLLHRGAEGVRKDLDTRIRLITMSGALDR